jgi:fumarylacetoacetate (FAA) hydrolase
VTADELGEAWHQGRVMLDLQVSRNDQWFGHPNGREMDFGFGELLSHLAYNRNLGAGTLLGSGTFSNRNQAEVGSSCLAERRAGSDRHWQAANAFHGVWRTFALRDARRHGGQRIWAVDNRYVAPDAPRGA